MRLLPFLLLVGCLGARPEAGRADDEAALRAAERAWLDAYDDNDVDAMRRIVADEFQIVYPNGNVVDKAGTIAFLAPGRPDDPATRQYTEGTVVRVDGDAAVLTGLYVTEGPSATRRSRYTDTWVWRDGRWQIVASQLTLLSSSGPD